MSDKMFNPEDIDNLDDDEVQKLALALTRRALKGLPKNGLPDLPGLSAVGNKIGSGDAITLAGGSGNRIRVFDLAKKALPYLKDMDLEVRDFYIPYAKSNISEFIFKMFLNVGRQIAEIIDKAKQPGIEIMKIDIGSRFHELIQDEKEKICGVLHPDCKLFHKIEDGLEKNPYITLEAMSAFAAHGFAVSDDKQNFLALEKEEAFDLYKSFTKDDLYQVAKLRFFSDRDYILTLNATMHNLTDIWKNYRIETRLDFPEFSDKMLDIATRAKSFFDDGSLGCNKFRKLMVSDGLTFDLTDPEMPGEETFYQFVTTMMMGLTGRIPSHFVDETILLLDYFCSLQAN